MASVFSSTGSCTVAATGVQARRGVGASAGTTGGTVVGRKALQTDGSAAGVGTGSARSSLGDGAAAGVSTAAAVGVRLGVGSAAGTTGGTVVGRKAMLTAGAASGIAAASAVAVNSSLGDGAAVGASTAAAVGVLAGVGLSVGASTAAAFATTADAASAGISTANAVPSVVAGAAAGVATADAVPSLIWEEPFAAAGVAVAAAVGAVSWASEAAEVDTLIAARAMTLSDTANATDTAAIQTAVCVSSGAASDTLVLLETRKAVASAAGVGAGAFVGDLSETLESTGAATEDVPVAIKVKEVSTGAAANELDVTHRRFVVGRSAGVATASALAIGGTNSVGAAAGSAVAAAVGLGAAPAVGSSAGIAAVSGSIAAVFNAVAHAAGAATVSGARAGRQLAIIEDVCIAEDELQFPVPTVYPVFWANTIGQAGATWDGLPFNSMVEVDGVVYAAGAAGLFRMEDLADDNGDEVLTDVEWDLSDVGHSDYKQRARSLYVAAIADGPFTVKVTNKQGQFEHQTHLPSSSKMVNHRAPLGRGMTSRAMRVNLQQRHYFSVADVNIGIGDTTRRI